MPPEGGEHDLPVTLDRDTGQGGMRFTFEDERGQRCKYVELQRAAAHDPGARASGPGGRHRLRGEGRPAVPRRSRRGSYRFGIRAFAYAPADGRHGGRRRRGDRVSRRVPRGRAAAGEVHGAHGADGPLPHHAERPARARAARDGGARRRRHAGGGRRPLRGRKASLLGGLASGTYVVEVISEDLQPHAHLGHRARRRDRGGRDPRHPEVNGSDPNFPANVTAR